MLIIDDPTIDISREDMLGLIFKNEFHWRERKNTSLEAELRRENRPEPPIGE